MNIFELEPSYCENCGDHIMNPLYFYPKNGKNYYYCGKKYCKIAYLVNIGDYPNLLLCRIGFHNWTRKNEKIVCIKCFRDKGL